MRIEKLSKLFLLLCFGFIVTSCSIDDSKEELSFTYKLNSIKQVNLPDTFLSEEMYSFRVQFENPADCYEFEGFHLEMGENENERIITAVSTVINEQSSCVSYPTPKTESTALEFMVKREDYYVLKFWQGTDDNGEPIYLTKKVEIKK